MNLYGRIDPRCDWFKSKRQIVAENIDFLRFMLQSKQK